MSGQAGAENPLEAPRPHVAFAHNSEEEFARILDFYGVEWQYEPRSFTLREDNGRILEAFTPDFYLPELDFYIELTTLKQSLVTEKHRKMRRFQERYPDAQIKLLHKSDYLSLLAKFGYGPFSEVEVAGIHEVLISSSKIERRVSELGAAISRDYRQTEPLLVGVLRGVTVFMADLMRHISLPLAVDFMSISSYGGTESGSVRILKDLDTPLTDRDVLIVEDIVDTGMTLNTLLHELQLRRPASLKVCTLLDKRARRLVDVQIDYVGFQVPDEFVVGYGLDFQQKYRNLPFIALLKRDWLKSRAQINERPE